MNLFGNHMVTAILAESLVSVLLVALGFLVGKYRERRQLRGRDLTEYDFYPYQTTADNFAEFRMFVAEINSHKDQSDQRSSAGEIFTWLGSSFPLASKGIPPVPCRPAW